mmetsp:Transcript_30699/g.64337  ORF Transcript_30699/g.64337 Transcript_30699/m.64337 type:complete len:212 (-) Transcript_30699:1756-2391(-)
MSDSSGSSSSTSESHASCVFFFFVVDFAFLSGICIGAPPSPSSFDTDSSTFRRTFCDIVPASGAGFAAKKLSNVVAFFGVVLAFSTGFATTESPSDSSDESDSMSDSSDSDSSISESQVSRFVFFLGGFFRPRRYFLLFDLVCFCFLASMPIASSLLSRSSSIASKSANQIASGAVPLSVSTSSAFSSFCLWRSAARSNVSDQIFMPSKYS